jgi:hypothetical protein
VLTKTLLALPQAWRGPCHQRWKVAEQKWAFFLPSWLISHLATEEPSAEQVMLEQKERALARGNGIPVGVAEQEFAALWIA